jgi:hypothetical protein
MLCTASGRAGSYRHDHRDGDDNVGDFVATQNPRRGAPPPACCHRGQRPAAVDAEDRRRHAQPRGRRRVIVFRDQRHAPIAGRPLRCLPGNKIIVVWEGTDAGNDLALEVAVQLARTLAVSGERDDAKLNRKLLGDRIARLVNIVESADDIRRGIRGARKALDSPESPIRRCGTTRSRSSTNPRTGVRQGMTVLDDPRYSANWCVRSGNCPN